MKNQLALMVASSLVGSAMTIAAVYYLGSPNRDVVRITESATPSYSNMHVAMPVGEGVSQAVDFSATADKVTPAVVHIKTKGKLQNVMRRQSDPRGFNDRDMEEQFRYFFFDNPNLRQNPMPPSEKNGSGVIISPDGYIVTNNHVVAGAAEIEVVLSDKRTYKAKVVGTDPSSDLAVIQIKESKLSYLRFGNSDVAKVGNWVLAVGNPFNLSSTVTAGVISAKGRSIGIIADSLAIESFIQTDAAVNPGNSGGALVALNGDLIGINTAIQSPTGSFAGYSFAIPSKVVEKIVEDLIKYGEPQRGVLGVMIRDIDGALARNKDLSSTKGVYVDSLVPNGAAKAAGIKSGDVILKVDNISVQGSGELRERVSRKRPGDAVELTIDRDGKLMTLPVTLKSPQGRALNVKNNATNAFGRAGLDVEDLTEKELKRNDLTYGVKVKAIRAGGSISKETEMREGFIITHVDKKPVKTAKELTEALNKAQGGVLVEGVYPEIPGRYYYAFGTDDEK